MATAANPLEIYAEVYAGKRALMPVDHHVIRCDAQREDWPDESILAVIEAARQSARDLRAHHELAGWVNGLRAATPAQGSNLSGGSGADDRGRGWVPDQKG